MVFKKPKKPNGFTYELTIFKLHTYAYTRMRYILLFW